LASGVEAPYALRQGPRPIPREQVLWVMRAVARLGKKLQGGSAMRPEWGLMGSLPLAWAVAPQKTRALQAGGDEGGTPLFLA
jgi:hypothetical protein